MSKCGKGCMPECEYFTTGGCISPFNCQYKIETGYINSATSIPTYMEKQMSMTAEEIEHCLERFTMGKTTDVMNFDYAGTLVYIYKGSKPKTNSRRRRKMNKAEKSLRWVVNQIPDFKPTTNEEKMLVAIKLYSEAGAEEIKRLESENAALREKIEKALELPRIERLFNGKVGSYKVVYQDKNNRITSEYYSDEKREAAEARLNELKGEKK